MLKTWVNTAKRLRHKAQGCFKPGAFEVFGGNPERVASAVSTTLQCFKWLRRPWALGRNRVAVVSSNLRVQG
jgi:hypothetical protein